MQQYTTCNHSHLCPFRMHNHSEVLPHTAGRRKQCWVATQHALPTPCKRRQGTLLAQYPTKEGNHPPTPKKMRCARSGPHTMWVSPSMHELHTLPTSSRGVPKACSRTPTGPVTPQCSLTPTTARGQKKSDVESSHTMSQGTVEAGYVHQSLQANCYQESIWGATALCARLEVPAKQL
jgi:hypothetical protein